MDKQFEIWMKEYTNALYKGSDVKFDKEEFKTLLLTDEKIEKFYQYYLLLMKWNEVMNLTAITEMKEVILKHFVDSLSLIYAVPGLWKENISIIDIGTGAGFPGIPLKIAFSNLHITLLDSLNKRVKFLQEVIFQLDLKKIKAYHGRAEDYGRHNDREKYDLCVSRAVANLSTLSEYCLPFVKKKGYFISYKANKIEEELEKAEIAIKLLGGRLEKKITFQLPETELNRSLIVVKKIEKTAKKYPRRSGIPEKEPLT